MNTISLAQKVANEKKGKDKVIGSGLFQSIAFDPHATAGLGIETMKPGEAQEKLDSLFEACRQIEFTQHKKGKVYHEQISDKEAKEEIVKLDSKIIRLDAGEGRFLERDLEFMDPERYAIQYQDKTQWRRLFIQRELNAPGMDNYKYKMTDFTGEAEFGSDGATDAPMADSKGKWYRKEVNKIHLGYSYTLDEVRAHIYGTQPLELDKIDAVNRGYDQKMHRIIWDGDADHDIDGVLNHPSVGNVVAPTRETVVTWADKVAAASGGMNVIRDLRDFVANAQTASQNLYWNAEAPGMIAVPLAQYQLITSEPLDPGNASNVSIKQYAVNNIEGLKDIVPVIDVDGKGAGATDLAFGWVPDRRIMEIVTTMPITWQPMERRGQTFQFYSDMKFVGPVVRYTNGLYQMYGI